MKLTTVIRPFLWVLLCWALFTALSRFTTFPELHWFPLVLLGLGIFTFLERPLFKAGVPASMETSIASLLGLAFLAHVGFEVMVPYLDAEELAGKACGPQTLEARCYSYSNPNCISLWSHFEQECREEVKKSLTSRNATALTGGLVRQCTYKRLDQSFKGNRKASADPACQAHFNSLIDLSQ